MITLSLCMIVKNEQNTLPRLLESVSEVFDEIIIADTGSTDKTKEIAMSFTQKVYDFEWCDDFSAARNFSFSKATSDYIMWLDADDIIAKQDIQKLLELKSSLDFCTDVVMMKYHAAFDEQGKPTFSYFRERILKRQKNFLWQGVVHEAITPSGKIIYSDISVCHAKDKDAPYTQRNLLLYEKKLDKGESLDAREQFYYARELFYHKRYTKAIEIFKKFLINPDGWVQNKLSACLHLFQCYYAINKQSKAFESLLNSFKYSISAEVLCALGAFELENNNYTNAIFWYKSALLCQKDEQSGGFINQDCYDFIPNIQLAVCYDRLKDYKTANMYNTAAGNYKPTDRTFLTNREYFDNILSNGSHFEN